MKTADEMFEELGYEIVEDLEERIMYSIIGEVVQHTITFDYKTKRFVAYATINGECPLMRYVNMQEIKAINQKVKELGWEE